MSKDGVFYITPKILDFLANGDALSQDMPVFKYGGNVNGEKALRVELAPEQTQIDKLHIGYERLGITNALSLVQPKRYGRRSAFGGVRDE